MGKVTNLTCDSDESNERIKKRKRKKDLEEIRRNALAAKRNLRCRAVQPERTSFIKTLNQFASKRQEIEEVTQTQGILLNHKSRRVKDQFLPKPISTKGFFRGGIKGKEIRPLRPSQEQFKNAVLQGDALQLMQSGGMHYSKSEENSTKSTKDDIDPQMQKEIAKILKNSSESSSEIDESESAAQIDKSSPVLSRVKYFKRKGNVIKLDANKVLKDVAVRQVQSPVIKYVTKEEKCKRRLFESESENLVNKNSKYSNSNHYDDIDALRFSPRKSTPENVIFFAERIRDIDKEPKESFTNHKLLPTDPKLINCFTQTCKDIAEKELKDMFCNIEWKNFSIEDPMKTAKAALKTTYTNAFKDYLQRQKGEKSEKRCHSVDQSTVSSNSEIMLEPDSAIARALKKNTEHQMKHVQTKNNSNFIHVETGFYTKINSISNNQVKRKRAPSSKGECSEAEIPSSTKANADPKSVGIKSKLDDIHPERQELIARYLKDINTNNTYEQERNEARKFNRHYFEKEKLFISDSSKETYLVHKSTKHIPAILRKNRPLVDLVAKEKIWLNIEKHPGSSAVINKTSMHDFDTANNLESERTPSCGNIPSNQLIEAPKCKYVHMNAKYNQPSRINIPLMQAKNFQRKAAPERHLFPTTSNDRSFVDTQTFDLSPIMQGLGVTENKHDFHMCQLSQGNSHLSQESNCMRRMVSFGEIQDKTNRLTLCSSQSQKCSQESVEHIHSSQEEYSYPNLCYQQYQPTNNCTSYNTRACTKLEEVPVSPELKELNPNFVIHSYVPIECNGETSYIPKNDFQTVPSENHSYKRSEEFHYHPSNDNHAYRNQNLSNNQTSIMNCVPIQGQQQQPPVRQPVKFIAVEGNRIPQKRPVYNPNDNNSCSFTHKISVSNQQFAAPMNPALIYPKNTTSRLCYAAPSAQYNVQQLSSNALKSSNFNNDIVEQNRNPINFVPSNISNQTFINKQDLPMYSAISNQRYSGQQVMQMRMSPPSYAQVGCQHIHHNNNEDYKINDVYLKQITHNNYSQR